MSTKLLQVKLYTAFPVVYISHRLFFDQSNWKKKVCFIHSNLIWLHRATMKTCSHHPQSHSSHRESYFIYNKYCYCLILFCDILNMLHEKYVFHFLRMTSKINILKIVRPLQNFHILSVLYCIMLLPVWEMFVHTWYGGRSWEEVGLVQYLNIKGSILVG